MDSHRWKRLEALYIAALELTPTERTVFLDEALTDDPTLRQEIEEMLSIDEESIALAVENRLFLQRKTQQLPQEDLIGTQMGPYRLEKLIGKGGMGEVYLAHRADDQYEQKVALKLVRHGYRNSQLLSRFRMERQVLARLTHPNITRLLDGGIDPDGRPYLVMQYVEGLPITKFCDKHQLSIEDRLKLFQTVCAAVQHAHQNLIVHRDLKPSNILVTEDGVVKLLDFGIAKLLNPDWEMSVAVTQSQVRLMTPEYAAPEQVRGASITTATDVYALGVLLYELLSGRRPYRLSNRIHAEMERIVCEVDPAKPSTALTEASEDQKVTSPEGISRARRTVLSRLKKILQGDLDNIVLMALRKEPERRYASAEQFAQDIKRYLSGRPVSAERDRLAYRAKKFVQRNKQAVAVASIALMFLIGFGVVMAMQAAQIADQAAVLATERDRAERTAQTATATTAFLEDLFKASNPFEATTDRRDTLRVRDLLDDGVKNVEKDLVDQPEVQAALLDVLGSVHLNLGDAETAQPLLSKALRLRRGLHPAGHEDVAESMAAMAALYRIQGANTEAEALLTESLAILETQFGETHPRIAADLHQLGIVRQNLGAYDEAKALYSQAQTMLLNLEPRDNLKITYIQNDIAEVLYLQNELNQADSLYRIVLGERKSLLGSDHPDVAGTMTNLGMVLHRKGELEEAQTTYEEALEMRIEVLGANHPHVAESYNNLAALLKAKREYEPAESMYRKSLAIKRNLYGASHPAIANVLHNLGALKKAARVYDEAETLYTEALVMRRELFGEVHPDVASTLNNFGILLKAQRKYDRAEPLLRESLAVNRQLLPADHPRIGLTLDSLGDMLFRVGQYEESEKILNEALSILQKHFPEDHRFVKNTTKSLEDLKEVYRVPSAEVRVAND